MHYECMPSDTLINMHTHTHTHNSHTYCYHTSTPLSRAWCSKKWLGPYSVFTLCYWSTAKCKHTSHRMHYPHANNISDMQLQHCGLVRLSLSLAAISSEMAARPFAHCSRERAKQREILEQLKGTIFTQYPPIRHFVIQMFFASAFGSYSHMAKGKLPHRHILLAVTLHNIDL